MYINMNNQGKEMKMGNIKNLKNRLIMPCPLNYPVRLFILLFSSPLSLLFSSPLPLFFYSSSLYSMNIIPSCRIGVSADGSGSDDSSESESDNDGVKIDPDDPMAAYLAGEKKKSKSKKGSGDKEEKKRRKEERRKKREEKERRRLIKELKGKEGGKGKGVKRERRDEGDDEGIASRDIAGRDRRGGERIGRDGSRSPKLERRSPIAQPGRRDAPDGRDKRDERDEPRRREREMSPVRRSNGSERNGERDTRRNGQGGQYDDRRRDGNRSYPEDRYDDRRRDDRDSSYNRRDRP